MLGAPNVVSIGIYTVVIILEVVIRITSVVILQQAMPSFSIWIHLSYPYPTLPCIFNLQTDSYLLISKLTEIYCEVKNNIYLDFASTFSFQAMNTCPTRQITSKVQTLYYQFASRAIQCTEPPGNTEQIIASQGVTRGLKPLYDISICFRAKLQATM